MNATSERTFNLPTADTVAGKVSVYSTDGVAEFYGVNRWEDAQMFYAARNLLEALQSLLNQHDVYGKKIIPAIEAKARAALRKAGVE